MLGLICRWLVRGKSDAPAPERTMSAISATNYPLEPRIAFQLPAAKHQLMLLAVKLPLKSTCKCCFVEDGIEDIFTPGHRAIVLFREIAAM